MRTFRRARVISICCAEFATGDKCYEPKFQFLIIGLIFPFKLIGSPRARSKTMSSRVSLMRLWELGVNKAFRAGQSCEHTFQATAKQKMALLSRLQTEFRKRPLCVQWRAVSREPWHSIRLIPNGSKLRTMYFSNRFRKRVDVAKDSPRVGHTLAH